jgi:putative DNA primase/helicase
MNVPDYLMDRKIWLLWKYVLKDGKPTKEPFQPNGKHARSNDPTTWSTYQEAVANKQGYDGLGFFFDGTITGIDLDHCIDDENVINEQARIILEMCESYAEISPSGNGIHILMGNVIKNQAHSKSKDKTVEFYAAKMKDGKLEGGRFFTFTGNELRGYSAGEINCNNLIGLLTVYTDYVAPPDEEMVTSTVSPVAPSVDAQVQHCSVDVVVARMKKSKNWPEIKALIEGDTSAHHGDDSAADLALCNHLAFFAQKDEIVMDAAFRKSALYRAKWDEKHGAKTYGELTIERACRDTKKVYSGDPKFFNDDIGNSDRFVEKYRSELKYCEQQATWYLWNGNYWEQDLMLVVLELAKSVSKDMRVDEKKLKETIANTPADNKTARDQLKAHLKIMQQLIKYAASASGMNNLLKISKANPVFRISVSDLDTQMMKLNVVDQTLDFSSGSMVYYKPLRSDGLTKCCGCTFNPQAEAPLWTKFVSEIFGGDVELAQYVQKAVGYSLTGRVNEKCFFFLYGADGDNGKTVFLNVIRKMFGNYGQQASIKTFLKRKTDSDIRDDLVNLKGARFVTAVEPDESARFDMEVMKPLTGNDPIRCRTLHQRQIEYLPEAKLWIAGNNRPLITETNSAAWDRVRVIPFLVSFRGRKDRGLEDKLTLELSGILNWALEGYKLYVRDGLAVPKCMEESTDDYKKECNSFLAFVDLYCNLGHGKRVSSTVFFTAYTEYCAQEGLYAINMRKVKQSFKTMGIESVKGRDRNEYVGIELKPIEEEEIFMINNPRIKLLDEWDAEVTRQ